MKHLRAFLRLLVQHGPEILYRALPWLAFALIGGGCWAIYPPAAPIAVGLLILHDLSRKDPQQ